MASSLLLSVLISILSFGAVGDGVTDNTSAINRAISACASQGGGVVEMPRGVFVTGTVHMASHVMLRLKSGAVLRGISDLGKYESFVPSTDLSRYESGRGTANANSAYDKVWTKTLILFDGVDHSGIEGRGTIDGAHISNPNGEEHMRGPHAIIAANCKKLSISGIEIRRAGNYAFLGYDLRHSSFRGLRFNEGWDGIHIRGCEDVEIKNCDFKTGDDAIAGGYWNGMKITNNEINSSCNGIRMIQPSVNLLIAHNHFYGPGVNRHRTSGKTSSDAAISLEPGGWGPAPGILDNIRILHNRVETVLTPLSVTLGNDNVLEKITVSDLQAKDITRMALSVKSWGKGYTQKAVIKDVSMQFRGIDDPSLPDWFKTHGTAEWPVFPSWGMYFRRVGSVKLKHINMSHTGNDYRQPVIFDEVAKHKEK